MQQLQLIQALNPAPHPPEPNSCFSLQGSALSLMNESFNKLQLLQEMLNGLFFPSILCAAPLPNPPLLAGMIHSSSLSVTELQRA